MDEIELKFTRDQLKGLIASVNIAMRSGKLLEALPDINADMGLIAALAKMTRALEATSPSGTTTP